MVSFGKKIAERARGRFAPGLVSCFLLLLGFGATALLQRNVHLYEADNLRASFEAGADMTVQNLQRRIGAYAVIMSGVKGFINGSEFITYAEFREYVRNLHLDYAKGVQGIGAALIVSNAVKAMHVAKRRKSGLPDYRIKPEGRRNFYAPIVYMEPMAGDNLKALGFDVLTVPEAAAAMERARDRNEVAITSRISLVQDDDKPGVFGFVMYLPIYRNDAKLDTVEDRRAAVIGWVDVPFRMNDLMAGLEGEVDSAIYLEIHDGDPQSGSGLLYRSDGSEAQANLPEDAISTIRNLEVGGRRWTLLLKATPAYAARFSARHLTVIVYSAGLALTLTVSWLAWLLFRWGEIARMSYRKLFDQAGDGVLVMTRDHHFVDANPAALRMLGYVLDELKKLRLPDILAKHEYPRIKPNLVEMMSGATGLEDWEHVRKNGTRFIAEVGVRRLDGNRYFAILRDLTERKKAEYRILRLSLFYKALSQTNQVILRRTREKEIFPEVCRCAVDYGGMKMAWVGRLDCAGMRVFPVAGYGEGGDSLKELAISTNGEAFAEWPTGAGLRENRPVIVNRYLPDSLNERWRIRAERFNWKSAAAFPIFRGGKPYAVFNVFRGEENAFDGEAVDLFREMVADIGFALDNIDREVSRREAEKSLAESESRLSEIMENVGAYIYLKDSEGRYLYANRQMLELWGRSLDEVVGFTAEKFYDSETAARIRETDGRVLVEGETVRREEIKTIPDTGKTITCWSVNIPLRRKDGGIYALCGISTDISERIRLESSLREKEHMLSESQRIAGIGSWCIEYPSGRIAWSDQSYRINRVRPERFGHTLEAFIKLIHPEDRQSMLDWIQSCLAGSLPGPLRIKSLAGDGEARILEVQGEMKRGPDGKPSEINGTMQDITERWLAERQIRLNAKVFECNQEGIVIADSYNKVVSVNRAYSEITGYAAEEVVGKNPRFLTAEKYERWFYRKMWRDVRNKGRWQGEVFNRRKNGDFYPQWLSISVIRDETGRISHFIGIVNDMTEYKKAEERIRFLSNFDDLTGLPNLHLLRDRTEVALASAKRSQGTAVLMYIDLDRFKIVNDSLGHNAGDRLLKELSARLVRNLHGDDTLCRHGGDEFLLLLPDTDPEGAAHVARRILGCISKPFDIDGNRLMPTASIGIAAFPEDGFNFERLVQSADAALFRAKKRGRNCFQFFTPQMHEQAQEELQVENDLRLALERRELLLHYQPLIDAKNLRIVGAEALIRWRHPGKGIVPPGHFIPIAEESGLIVEIGNWVLNAAVRQMADWRAAGAPLVPVAVNLSAMQFRQETFFQTVATVLRANNLEPEALELELTENIAMENSERTIELFKRLHNLGVVLSLDDFGTGYSSLGYLKRFKINKLKIDQSFVRGLGCNPEDETIVITIINMAKSLGFKTIAEGVETREQLVFLQERGCDVIQGYFFSRPVPADAFTELLMKGVPLSGTDADGGGG